VPDRFQSSADASGIGRRRRRAIAAINELQQKRGIMGARMMGRILQVAAGALSVVVLTGGVASAAPVPPCTNTYTGSGDWFDSAAWSAGHIPTATDSVCIPGPGGPYVGNDSITVANLTIGATGTLSIGNGGASLGRFAVTGTLTNDGTIETSWGGTFSATKLVNVGTFDIPWTGYVEDMSFGDVLNTGTFAAIGGAATVNLANGGTFDNAGGTLATVPQIISSNTFLGDITMTSPSSGRGTLVIGPGSVVDVDAPQSIVVADAVDIVGGSICGGPLVIGFDDGGSGGSLSFSGALDPAPDCSGISGPSDAIAISNVPASLSGTIPDGYTITVGDAGSSHATLTLVGQVVNQGTLQIGGGAQLIGHAAADTLVNQGTLDVGSAGEPVALDTGLTNLGAFDVSGAVDATLGNAQAWTNGTDGTNASMMIDGALTVVSSPGRSAPFTQDGTIDNAGSLEVAEPVEIAGGSICGGALEVGSFEDNLGGTLAWAPTLAPGAGCAAGAATDMVAVDDVPVTLTGDIPAKYTLTLSGFAFDGVQPDTQLFTPGPMVNDGTLIADTGSQVTVGGIFTNRGTFVADLEDIYPVTLTAPHTLNLGRLEVSAGTLDVAGSLENGGKLKLAGPGQRLAVSGDYTQDADARLVDLLSTVDTNLAPVVVVGAATLAGAVRLSLPTGVTEDTFLTDDGTDGAFSTVMGPYALSYSPTGVTATLRPKPTAAPKIPAG
jgi:hypothetical protein